LANTHLLNKLALWQTSQNVRALIVQSSRIAIGTQQKKISCIRPTLLTHHSQWKMKNLIAKCTGEQRLSPSINNLKTSLKRNKMKRQTAVEWLKKELEDYGSNSHLSLDWNTFDELCEQAKAMEREQLEYSYDRGVEEGQWTESDNYDIEQCTSSSEFYKKTYGGQDEN
jgi:hypothetical protein